MNTTICVDPCPLCGALPVSRDGRATWTIVHDARPHWGRVAYLGETFEETFRGA